MHFEILLATYQSIWGILFGISSALMYGLVPQKIVEAYFGNFCIFLIFGWYFEIMFLLWPLIAKCDLFWKFLLIFATTKNKFCIFRRYNLPWEVKRGAKFQKCNKTDKKRKKITQKFFCIFLRSWAMYQFTWYAKQNLPCWLISG